MTRPPRTDTGRELDRLLSGGTIRSGCAERGAASRLPLALSNALISAHSPTLITPHIITYTTPYTQSISKEQE